jgi:hypothetical protein
MTTYIEFNRDLFLCNALQRDTDANFSSLLFEHTNGNSISTYHNFQKAKFYFIPKTNSNSYWQSLPNNVTFTNVDEVLNQLKSTKDICNNNPPYIITFKLYSDLKNNSFKYDEFIKQKNNYSTDNYIYAYTFGKLQELDISAINPVSPGGDTMEFDIDQEPFTLGKSLNNAFKHVGNKIKEAKPKPNIGNSLKNAFQNVGTKIQQQVNTTKPPTPIPTPTPTPTNKLTNKLIIKTDKRGVKQLTVTKPAKSKNEVIRISNLVNNSANTAADDIVNKIRNNTNKIMQNCRVKGDKITCSISKLFGIFQTSIFQKREGFEWDRVKNVLATTFASNANTALSTSPAQTYYTSKQLKIYQFSDTLYPVMDISCAKYPINAVCATTNSLDGKNCEICKNFAYRDWYDANNNNNIKSFVNHDDRKHEYFRIWLQTCNLGIGILLLSIGVYYQQSN